MVTRGRNLEVEQLDGSDPKVLKIHKYWGCNVQQLTLLFGMFAARVNPKNSIRRTFFFLFCSCVRRWILTKSIVVSFCGTFVLSRYELHFKHTQSWTSVMGFPGGAVVKNLAANAETQETRAWSLGQEEALEEEMATIPGLLPEISHGQRSHGVAKSQTRLSTHTCQLYPSKTEKKIACQSMKVRVLFIYFCL